MTELPPPPASSPEAHAREAFMEAIKPTLDPVAKELGHEAVREAERLTEQAAHGRGLGDEAEGYLARQPVSEGAEDYLRGEASRTGIGFSSWLSEAQKLQDATRDAHSGDAKRSEYERMLKESTPKRLAPSAPASEGSPAPLHGIQAEAWQRMQQGLRGKE